MHRNLRAQGNILVVTLIMVVVIAAFVGVAMNVTGNTARMTDRSRDYAAEGAVEYAFGIWKTRIAAQNRAITTAEANSGVTAPVLPGFTYAAVIEDGPLKNRRPR